MNKKEKQKRDFFFFLIQVLVTQLCYTCLSLKKRTQISHGKFPLKKFPLGQQSVNKVNKIKRAPGLFLPADELALRDLLQLQHLVHLVDVVVPVKLPDAVLGDDHLRAGLLVALDQVQLEVLVRVVVGDHLPVLLRPAIKGQLLAQVSHLRGTIARSVSQLCNGRGSPAGSPSSSDQRPASGAGLSPEGNDCEISESIV